MSPSGRCSCALLLACSICGCNWSVDFVPYQQCGVERPVDQPPDWEPLLQQPVTSPGESPSFRATAGCTIRIDVFHASSVVIDDYYDQGPDPLLVDVPYEIRVEPLQPEGRIERGLLDGIVTVETSIRNTSVTITLFLPNDREEDGIQEESAIIYLDPPE